MKRAELIQLILEVINEGEEQLVAPDNIQYNQTGPTEIDVLLETAYIENQKAETSLMSILRKNKVDVSRIKENGFRRFINVKGLMPSVVENIREALTKQKKFTLMN